MSSDRFHGFSAGDTVETADGRIAEVKFVGAEPYTGEQGMRIEFLDGTDRFLRWNVPRDVDAINRLVQI